MTTAANQPRSEGERDPLFVLDRVRCRLGTQMIPNDDGWTIDIGRGSRLAVLGRSGSGKTTFLHVLGLLAPAGFGSVKFRPKNTDELDYHELYQRPPVNLRKLRSERFGFVFQDDHLLDTLSTEHNLALPLLLRRGTKGPALAEARKQAQRFFKPEELEGILKRNPSDLSGGQRSRIALVRGLMANPEVLFLDEPFTYLDNAQITRALNWLKEWQGEAADRTLIIVTHHLDQAVEIATHFLVLAPDGRILSRSAAELGSIDDRMEWLKELLPDERKVSFE